MLSCFCNYKLCLGMNEKEVHIFVDLHHLEEINGSTVTSLYFHLDYMYNSFPKQSASIHALRAGDVRLR